MLHPSIPMSFVMSAGLEQVETSLSASDKRPGNKFVLIQDCFRHFDLEAVGTDNAHLSFFEMPGAFVFGKNERQSTIRHMWKLVTQALGIDPAHIWVSYFRGDKLGNQEFSRDERTYQAWRNIGIPPNRLVGLGIPDNYWIQGDGLQKSALHSRKCGPSTELFYDLGAERSCGRDCQPGCWCGRFVEFSNSLFITHNLTPALTGLKSMANPFTETVIGTERISMILQNAPSVFDTTDYRFLIRFVRESAIQTNLSPHLIRESECVIADHLKALCKLVADGAPPPGKNGRERIIKLLIRRILTRQILLGITSQDFPCLLITSLVGTNGNRPIQKKVIEYFERESQRFRKTIDRGCCQLEQMLAQNQGQSLSGSQILDLEKKWGLPRLLTETMLHEKGLPFSETEYKSALAEWHN